MLLKKKQRNGLKFNPGLALTSLLATETWCNMNLKYAPGAVYFTSATPYQMTGWQWSNNSA